MAFTFNGAQANVTLSGDTTLPVTGANQTLISQYFVLGGGYETVYTVPANKIFYLHTINYTHNGAGSVNVLDDADATFITFRTPNPGTVGLSSPVPIKSFAAAEEVGVNGTAVSQIHISGFLVDA